MVRYEITAKHGLILETKYIKKVVAAIPKQLPTLIVFVPSKDATIFEKQIEGNNLVLKYHADPRAPGIVSKEWTRP